MKLQIEKLDTGKLKVELIVDSAKKPYSVELDRAQLSGIIQLLQSAQHADKLKLVLEL